MWRPLSPDILLSSFDMFHRLLGCYSSYCAAQLVTGTWGKTSERKQNIATEWMPHNVVHLSTCFDIVKSLRAGDAERLERNASMATELSWKKRAEHSLSDLVLSFMKAGLTHLCRDVHQVVHNVLLT